MEIVLLEVEPAAVVCSVVRPAGPAATVRMAHHSFPIPGATFGFNVLPGQLGLSAAEFPAVEAAVRGLYTRRETTPIGTRVAV